MIHDIASRTCHAPVTGILLLVLHASPCALADGDQALPAITVEGESTDTGPAFPVDLERLPVSSPDTAALLRAAPGANVNRNGPLTGLVQYRGMYGSRINTQIDGMTINSGGPNGMDPPISYLPSTQLGSLQIIRGIAPVSSGLETLGGTVIATSRRAPFAPGDDPSRRFEITAGGASVNDAANLGVMAALASRRHRLQLTGSHEKGDDYAFPGGDVVPSRHRRDNYAGSYGYRSGRHEFSFDLRRNETGETGTPALPMDIRFIDSNLAQGEYRGEAMGYRLHGQLYRSEVDHEMSNYDLRTPAMPSKTRLNTTGSEGLGYRFDAGWAAGSGDLTFGADGHLADHDATITDPVNNPAFRVVNFNGIERDLHGVFVEWEGDLVDRWRMTFGARYNRVAMDAGKVSHSMAGMNAGIATLENRFNSADRSQSDTNLDLFARFSRPLSPSLSMEFEAGRKTRSPSYQERYLWIPLQATNGLADGNNYVGTIDLDPELSHEIGMGLNWHAGRFYLEPRVFYREVDDYIQGVPATDPVVIMVSIMNGDPSPLRFANVDARLYGADAVWGVVLDGNWSLDGVISYVRGKRDDISDNLYRVAPLNGRLSLTYRRHRWWVTAEAEMYAEQDRVSASNDEQKSDGYALLNLGVGMELGRDTLLTGGIGNALDEEYQDHLTGINRVVGTDVAVGDRLPGPGRNVFVSLRYAFR